MSGRTRLTRAESKARTRAELVTAARRVFVERGYAKATLEAVADEAGYSTGAIYSAFRGKADLFLAVLDLRIAERASQMEKAGAGATSVGEHAELLARQFAVAGKHERAWSLLMIEFWVEAARDPELRRQFAQRHDALKAAVSTAIEGVLARSGERLTVSVDEVATAATALANGLTLEGLTDTVSDDLFPTVARLIMDGLTDRSRSGARP